jgi:hypothetical protein
MKKLQGMFPVAAGAALVAAVLYDATSITRSLGVPVEGGEALVVLAALALATVLFVRGWRSAAKVAAWAGRQR